MRHLLQEVAVGLSVPEKQPTLLPGKLQKSLEEVGFGRLELLRNVNIQTGVVDNSPTLTQMITPNERFRFYLDAAGKEASVDFLGNRVTLSSLAYTGWPNYVPWITNVLKRIEATAVESPMNAEMPTLAYVNFFEFESGTECVDSFNVKLHPVDDPDAVESFVLGFEERVTVGKSVIMVKTHIASVSIDRGLGVTLTLSATSEPGPKSTTEILSWLELAHTNLTNRFTNLVKKEG